MIRTVYHYFLVAAFSILSIAFVECLEAGTTGNDFALVWRDEFDGPTIDFSKWSHQVFPGVDSGNNELQYYTARSQNSFTRDGKLVIQAREESYQNHDYTSARLHTFRKFDFLYGKAEARIKIPSGHGIWPAFWMMPTDSVYGGWPRSGEIDIMESVNIANSVHQALHFGAPGHTYHSNEYIPGGPINFADDFHVYCMIWEPRRIRWYVDDTWVYTQTDWRTSGGEYPAPFDQRFHLILNVAVGGNWPGPPNGDSVFPMEMEVDWARVYQEPPQSTNYILRRSMNGTLGDDMGGSAYGFYGYGPPHVELPGAATPQLTTRSEGVSRTRGDEAMRLNVDLDKGDEYTFFGLTVQHHKPLDISGAILCFQAKLGSPTAFNEWRIRLEDDQPSGDGEYLNTSLPVSLTTEYQQFEFPVAAFLGGEQNVYPARFRQLVFASSNEQAQPTDPIEVDIVVDEVVILHQKRTGSEWILY